MAKESQTPGCGHVGDANRNILPEIRDAHLRTEEVRERPGVRNILLKMTEDGVRTVPMFPEKKLSVYRFSNVIATVFKAMKKDEQQTRKEIIR